MTALRGERTSPRTAGALAAAVIGASLVAAPQASADDGGLRMTTFDIDYVVGADGGVDVTENFAVRYDTPHHGIDRLVITGQGYSSDKHRLYPMTGVSVTSSTGAPTQVARSRQGGAERLRIGSKNRTVSGLQRYTVRYHLAGVVNKQPNGSTEFYWNPFDSTTQTPIDQVSITLRGPGAVSDTRCWYGPKNSTQTCMSREGDPATFTAHDLGQGRGMSIDAALPTSAFTNTAPILADGSAEDAFGDNGPFTSKARTALDGAGAGVSALVAALGGAWFWRKRRAGTDERFSGVTPGELPAPGQDAPVVRAPDPQVSVRFEPPRDATAGLTGLIIDRRADNRDIAGTIVDLAVRGYLTMTQVSKKDWQLTASPQQPAGSLLPYEADLLNALFEDGPTVQLSDLKNHFAEHLSDAKSGLERESVERGWFRQSPSASEGAARGLAIAFVVLAVVAFTGAQALHLNGFLFAFGFAILAGLAMLRSRTAAARTAVGSAVYDQARGFELYLKTAEAKQFRFEEAEQIFSRYMPYAVVLGLAERWAKVFGEVASAAQAQGYPLAMPYWYMPYGGWGGGFGGGFDDLGSGLEAFSDVASSALASTPGSSGGSGFSGGGFSGGGGGGGSVGGW